jgi:hypothetical protein
VLLVEDLLGGLWLDALLRGVSAPQCWGDYACEGALGVGGGPDWEVRRDWGFAEEFDMEMIEL